MPRVIHSTSPALINGEAMAIRRYRRLRSGNRGSIDGRASGVGGGNSKQS